MPTNESSRAGCVVELCKLGACYRQLGRLHEAAQALTKAIELARGEIEPFWQRHLLFRIYGDYSRALEDVSELLRIESRSVKGLRAKGDLLLKLKKYTDAVISYDLQLMFDDSDGDAHFNRGVALLSCGELDRGMADFHTAGLMDSSNAEAHVQFGRYQHSKGLYRVAINEFNAAAAKKPLIGDIYLARGLAHLALKDYTAAIRDFTQCIHLDPSNWEAFFNRGALLRTVKPRQALSDLSTSILINCTTANLRAFLHRGMQYLKMNKFEAADPDFRMVLLLDQLARVRRPTWTSSFYAVLAHCHLGLISMLFYGNLSAAARNFGLAVAEDPTYVFSFIPKVFCAIKFLLVLIVMDMLVFRLHARCYFELFFFRYVRGYLCRAECFYRIHKDCGNAPQALIKGAAEYAKAIRLHPNRPEYYVLRGKLLLALGDLDAARYHIRAASALRQGIADNIAIEAQVQSFLGNHIEGIKMMHGLVGYLEEKSIMGSNEKTPMISTLTQCHRDLPPSLYLLGKLLSKAGRHVEAIRYYEQALQFDNTKAEWFYELGLCCVLVKDDPLALEAFAAAIELSPRHARSWYQLGACKVRQSNQRGIRDINKALSLNGELWEAYLTRASYYGIMGRYSKAILNCNEAIALRPRSVRAYLTRGCLKMQNNFMPSAIEDVSEAISIDSSCSLAFYNRAVCYQRIGEKQKALRDYSLVLLLDDQPNYVVFQNRGMLYFSEGDWANALCDFTRMTELPSLANDPRVKHSISLCLHKLGRFEEAVDHYSAALEADPLFVEALLGRGNVFTDYAHAVGRLEGRRDYQRAIRMDPRCISAYVNLAYSLQCDGRFMDAWNVVSSALRINKRSQMALECRAIINLQMLNFRGALSDLCAAIGSKPTAELLTNRGVTHLYLDDPTRAMYDFQAALELDPGYHLALYNAGNVYTKQRQFTQALEFYDRAITASGGVDESYLNNRAVAKCMQHLASNSVVVGEANDQALQDLKAAAEVSPSSAFIHYNMACVHLNLKQWGEARDCFSRYLVRHPDDADAYSRRSFAAGKVGETSEAVKDSVRAATIAFNVGS